MARKYEMGMDERLIEVFGCMPKERKIQRTPVIEKEAMDDMLIEIFGCVPHETAMAKRVRKSRKDYYLDYASIENMLLEVFGCAPVDHRVIKLDQMRDRKRAAKDVIFHEFAVTSEAI